MNICCVVAHPDDCELLCGGTIARGIQDGHNVSIVHLATGLMARDNNKYTICDLQSDSERSLVSLGVKKENIVFMDFPDNKMDTVPLLDICKFVERQIHCFMPTVIITHYQHCMNIDHQRTFEAVRVATRSSDISVLQGEVAGSTESDFKPNYYVKLNANHIGKKKSAIGCYKSEATKIRSGLALEHKAQTRGMEIGVDYAEAFKVYKISV